MIIQGLSTGSELSLISSDLKIPLWFHNQSGREIRVSPQGWVSAALVGVWSLPQLPVCGWRAYTWQPAEPPCGFPCLGLDATSVEMGQK